jgi:hypothetical protein
MTFQWIDAVAGVAYIRVEGPVLPMQQFLEMMDGLLVNPRWRHGMPVIQDIRGLTSTPPASCVDEWDDYVRLRRPLLEGCRIAVVARGDDPGLETVVTGCRQAASPAWVSVAMFRDMSAAHLWALRLAEA